MSKSKTSCLVYSTALSILLLSATSIAAQVKPEKIKIGVAVPLTGAGAAYGVDIKNALVFANKKMANSAYELIIEDDQCSNREAAAAAQRLVNNEKVKYALGFGCSGTVLAAAPIYEKAEVVVIASGTGAPAITNAGDYIFRTKPSLNYAAELLVNDFARSFKKIGIISEETDYCQGLLGAIQKDAKDLKLEIVNHNYNPGNEDFKSTLLKLKNSGVDALFFNPQGENAMVNLYRQYRELKMDLPVYGTFMPGGEIFLTAFGAKADGVIYADVQFNKKMLNPIGYKLYLEFEQEHGKAKAAEHFSALSLVAFNTLHQAIQSGQDVKKYLYENTFEDLVPTYSFDQNGDIVSDHIAYVLKTIKNGIPVSYEPSN